MDVVLWIAGVVVALAIGLLVGFWYRYHSTNSSSPPGIDGVEGNGVEGNGVEGNGVEGPAAEPSDAASRTEHVEDPPDHEQRVIDLRQQPSDIPVHNLQFVEGIGPKLDKGLARNGITSLAEFVAVDEHRLRELAGGNFGLNAERAANKLQPRAQEMLEAAERGEVRAPLDCSELLRIDGVGSTMCRFLETKGISSLEQIVALDATDIDALQRDLSDYPDRIRRQRWRAQARRLGRTASTT